MQSALAVVVAALVLAIAQSYSTNIKSGYIILSATFTNDNTCAYGSLATATYVNVGACVPTGASSSVLYSTDINNAVYLDTWSNSATCTGAANVAANVLQTPSTCVLSNGVGSVPALYTTSYAYVTSLSSLVWGNYANQLYFQTNSCATSYGGVVTPSNIVSSANALAGCTSNPQCTATTYAWGNGFSQIACVIVTAASPGTSLVIGGNVIYAQNYGYGCSSTNLPQYVNQFPPSTCSPFAAGTSFQTGTSNNYGYTTALSSQHLVFTYESKTTVSFVAYTGAGCTGAVVAIYNFASSQTACKAGFNGQQIVYYSATTTFPQVAGLTSTSIYTSTKYYSSVDGCQGTTTNTLQWTQYYFPGYLYNSPSQCNALQYNGLYIAPFTSSYGVLCSTASTATSSFATAVIYSNSQCTSAAAFAANAYQLGVCTINGASTSFTLTSSTDSATGITTITTNTFPTLTCTGTPSATIFGTSNCVASTIKPGYYQTFNVASGVGASLVGTANSLALQQNSLTWVAGYNDQAACNAGPVTASIPNMAYLVGAVATCTAYVAPNQVSTTSFATSTVNGCQPPAPTATPTAAGMKASTPTMGPTQYPTVAPLNQVTYGAAQGATLSCFAGSEQVTLEGGASKAMSDLAVGDRILTVNAQGKQVYSDVAYLPHGQNAVKTTFTAIATEAGRDLKMTPNHMLPAGTCDATASLPVVAAGNVVVGDCVQTVWGRERVLSVSQVEGEGIYTAIAMEELIVVNGVVVTPYGGVNPALANVYYNIHRLAYKAAGKALLAAQGATEGVWAVLGSLAASF